MLRWYPATPVVVRADRAPTHWARVAGRQPGPEGGSQVGAARALQFCFGGRLGLTEALTLL